MGSSSLDITALDGVLLQPSVASVLAYHATLRDRLKDPMALFRDLIHRYCEVFVMYVYAYARARTRTRTHAIQQI